MELHEGRVGMGATSDVATWVAGASLGTMPDVRGLVADLTPAAAAR
jgi:hypothetical protein